MLFAERPNAAYRRDHFLLPQCSQAIGGIRRGPWMGACAIGQDQNGRRSAGRHTFSDQAAAPQNSHRPGAAQARCSVPCQ